MPSSFKAHVAMKFSASTTATFLPDQTRSVNHGQPGSKGGTSSLAVPGGFLGHRGFRQFICHQSTLARSHVLRRHRGTSVTLALKKGGCLMEDEENCLFV